MTQVNTQNLIEVSNYKNYSFAQNFINIIEEKANNYDNKGDFKDNLKGFFEDLGRGGCMSGMIADFIYHDDCKTFYIAHIDDLEEFKNEIEEGICEKIENRHDLPHYTFLVWLTFEEFCYNMYANLFEN